MVDRARTMGLQRWKALVLLVFAVMALTFVRGTSVSGEPLPVHGAVFAWMAEHPGQPVPLIVQHDGSPDDVFALLEEAGGTVERELRIIPALDVTVPPGRVLELARSESVAWVSLDAPLQSAHGSLDNEPLPNAQKLANAYPAAVRATKVWSKYAGADVTVAVIDTGISDDGQPDFAHGDTPRVGMEVVLNDAADGEEDGFGHGTHVAGIIGGDGSLLKDTRYAGVAPLVNLIDLRIGDDQGQATVGDLLAALEWVDDNRDSYNIRVVNLSLTSSVAQSYLVDPIDAAVELLWFHDVAVVVSAGNLGTASDAVYYPPANDPFVIVVGAVDDAGTVDLDDDALAPWSSRGLTQDDVAKPDVVAPGVDIISDIDPASYLATMYPQYLVDGNYFRMSGTSMAAAVASGVVALVREARPEWLPGEVKYVLQQTSVPIVGSDVGLLQTDAAIAYDGPVLSTDDGIKPNYMLLAAAGVDEADFDGIRWRDALFDGLRWRGLELNGIRWGQVDWDGIRWGNVDFDGVRWGGLSLDGIRWGGLRWGSLLAE